jgi:hypothetical protein
MTDNGGTPPNTPGTEKTPPGNAPEPEKRATEHIPEEGTERELKPREKEGEGDGEGVAKSGKVAPGTFRAPIKRGRPSTRPSLKKYAEAVKKGFGFETYTARLLGRSRRSVGRDREADPRIEELFEDAKEENKDRWEGNLMRVASDRTHKQHVTANLALLNAHGKDRGYGRGEVVVADPGTRERQEERRAVAETIMADPQARKAVSLALVNKYKAAREPQ